MAAKLIVGLGNPGSAYKLSRHNLGFMVVQGLAKEYNIEFRRSFLQKSLIAKVMACGDVLILSMPLTFMNLSGSAVKSLVHKYKIALPDLLIICDDLSLPLGKIRIRPRGSSGGHKGLASIIEKLHTDNFSRLKIGIGQPEICEASEFVLGGFKKSELTQIKPAIKEAVECSKAWLENGVNKAMGEFN